MPRLIKLAIVVGTALLVVLASAPARLYAGQTPPPRLVVFEAFMRPT